MHLPLPASVVGMCALFLGLQTGVLRLSWFEAGAALMTRHLAMFFLPFTVGVAAFGSTFERAGLGIVVSLVISAVVGLVAAGWTTQALAAERAR